MASRNMPKLSLVAQYDDLCRYTKVLTGGCEKEFRQYVEVQKRLFQKRKQAEADIETLRKKVAGLEYENQSYETKLKHMKKVIMSEVEQRKKLEQEKASMERQIALIKDVLLNDGNTIDKETKEKFFQLSSACKYQTTSPYKLTTIEESVGSLLSSDDCDESDTETDLGITHRKRRSRGKKSSGDRSMKKRKSEERNRLSLEDAFKLDDLKILSRKMPMNFRSNSDSNTNSLESLTPRPIIRSDSEQITRLKKYNTLGYNGSTPVSCFDLGRHTTNKTHDFVSKTIIKPEKCYPCGKSIKCFQQVLKCINCRVVSHPECRDKCPEYCIYTSATPTGGLTGILSDYTPSTSPMIPPIIMHCVHQIEAKGLDIVGLYRESASKNEIKNLTEKFLRGKSLPSLNEVDVHVLCGTIKSFLRSLKETLITRNAWKTFVDAASSTNETESLNLVFDAVCDLPQPNRETLAFLILHFQRIADSPECKMPLDNLAKVVGPTIVGYSTPESAETNALPETLTETRLQYKVMEKLLMIPSDSWKSLLNDENNIYHKVMKTPECTPAPVTSRLGPIVSSGQKSRTTTPTTRTPLSRVTKAKMPKRKFLSPLMKLH